MHELDYNLVELAKEEYRLRPNAMLRRLCMRYQAAQALSEIRVSYIAIARHRRNKLKDCLKEISCEGV